MDLPSLLSCLSTSSCAITQITSGLIVGMVLFLVAAGLSLIFGVLKVVNFTHGSFYMLGAYFAHSTLRITGSYAAAVLVGAAGVALCALAFERLFMSRVYGSNVLRQLLVCYAFILIFDDLVKIVWGREFLSAGMPDAFRVPPYRIAGGLVPRFYVFLIVMALAVGVALSLAIGRTRAGKIVRAAAHNPGMVSALGTNTSFVFGAVFAAGGLLAGLGGALAAPVRSLAPGMGFSILIESFIVTVIGGMGSIAGAFVGSILLGLTRSFGTIGFPLFTDGLVSLMMVAVLVVRPTGLFGRPVE